MRIKYLGRKFIKYEWDMGPVFISVVITVRNEERHISDLLDSLIIQEPPFEIVIVDAHSEDGTVDIIKKYHQKRGLLIL